MTKDKRCRFKNKSVRFIRLALPIFGVERPSAFLRIGSICETEGELETLLGDMTNYLCARFFAKSKRNASDIMTGCPST